ncbi:MAG: thiamine pyrophosphate-binding protein [Chloroflexota bacterium]|nr:thiamine pyrophosphate-binding protein [Chloroflexota bacterium]
MTASEGVGRGNEVSRGVGARSAASVEGGQLLAEALAAEGVRCVFTVSGGSLNPLYEASAERGIRLIHARHDGNIALMADSWARATGEPGVCATTLGPGVTNTMTGLLAAEMAASPIVVLAAQAPVGIWDLGTPQAHEHLSLVRPITKWARTVYETRRIPEYVGAAFHHARSGRPGPVFLELPADVLRGTVPDGQVVRTQGRRTVARPLGDPEQVARAAALLAAAERPVIVAGSGVWWSGASAELTALVEAAGAPVFTGRIGRGSVPADHPLCFGIAAVSVNDVFARALAECDLVLMVGGRFDSMLGFGRPPVCNAARAIQVDIEAEEIGRNRPIDVGIVADARQALIQLREALAGQHHGAHRFDAQRHACRATWVTRLCDERDRVLAERAPHEASDAAPLHPLRLLKEIREVVERDAILIVGSGDIDFWGEHYFEPYVPGTYLRSGQAGALGAEIPYGVAAKLAHPERQVLVLVGDGGFGYAAMELETAARYGAPLVVVIGNDRAWGMIKHQQEHAYGRVVETDLVDRPYEQIAAVLGGYGERVSAPNELRGALERAFAAGVPACLNVDIQSIPSPELRYMLRPAR